MWRKTFAWECAKLTLAYIAVMVFLVLVMHTHGEESSMGLRVTPYRDGVILQVRIEPSDTNRWLAVSWQNVDSLSGGGSQRELDGKEAPLVTSIEVPSLSSGHYLAVATLYNRDGKQIDHIEREFFR